FFWRRRTAFPDPGGDAKGDLAGGDVARNHGAGTGVGAFAHGHRCAEDRVRADEGARVDGRGVLAHAVVVRRDRARADVHVLAHLRVADVAEVVLLGALADAAFLDLRVVTQLDAAADVRAGAEMAERPDPAVVLNHGALQDAGPDHVPLADPAVHDLGA